MKVDDIREKVHLFLFLFYHLEKRQLFFSENLDDSKQKFYLCV